MLAWGQSVSVRQLQGRSLASWSHCRQHRPFPLYIHMITIYLKRVYCWWRIIVVRPSVLPACFPYPCARLTAGRVTTLWVKRPLPVNQQGRLSLPSLRGRINDGLQRWRPTADWRCLANGQVAAQACVCRLWAVAWVAGGFGQWRERIRGGLTTGLTEGLRRTRRCAI